jgi:hypothetical protein
MRFKVIPTCVALALIAGVALLTLSLTPGETSANDDRDHRSAENTFTKWLTTFPNMAGVVGGDVGRGTYAGEILNFQPGVPGSPTFLEALYHFNGRKHSFTAHVYVTQINLKAVIIGVVTEGWLKGNLVQGEYTQIQCSHDGITTDCFQGTLDILRGTKH